MKNTRGTRSDVSVLDAATGEKKNKNKNKKEGEKGDSSIFRVSFE